MTDQHTAEQLLIETSRLLRAMRDEHVATGEMSGRSQRAADDLIRRIDGRPAAPALPDYQSAMKAAGCDEGVDCDTFIRVLQKKIADQQRELSRLQRPAAPPSSREPPHCSSCACGLATPPPVAQEYESIGYQHQVHSSWGGTVWVDTPEARNGSAPIASREVFVKRAGIETEGSRS